MPTPQSPSIQARVDRRTRFPRERRASRFLTVRASSGRTASGTSSTSRRPTTCQLHAKQEEKHERSERITQKNRQQRVEHTHTHMEEPLNFLVFFQVGLPPWHSRTMSSIAALSAAPRLGLARWDGGGVEATLRGC